MYPVLFQNFKFGEMRALLLDWYSALVDTVEVSEIMVDVKVKNNILQHKVSQNTT